jgi:hypothetical protein
VLVVEDPSVPLNVTLQDVPEGKPVSVKFTTKVGVTTVTVKFMATVTLALPTVIEPDDGEAEKPLTLPIEYE